MKDIDISCISKFSSLNRLYLSENKTKKIDLSGMNLTELNIRYSKSITGIFSIKTLSTLILSHGNEDLFVLDFFSKLNNLKLLEVYQSNLPKDFSFLSKNAELKQLEIGYIRKSFALNGLEHINLNKLTISNSKKVDIDNLKNLTSIEELRLVDSVVIPSNDIFSRFERLKYLIILGSSFFSDGNLIELQKRVEYLGIDNKKHYNVKYIEPPINE